jgi:hypothetical protein
VILINPHPRAIEVFRQGVIAKIVLANPKTGLVAELGDIMATEGQIKRYLQSRVVAPIEKAD